MQKIRTAFAIVIGFASLITVFPRIEHCILPMVLTLAVNGIAEMAPRSPIWKWKIEIVPPEARRFAYRDLGPRSVKVKRALTGTTLSDTTGTRVSSS